MSVEDARMSNDVRHEIVKRSIDTSRLDVRVYHGVVYLSGEVRPIRGQDTDLRHEMGIIYKVLRQKPGIRDVVDEVRIWGCSDR
jgi:osmotically-inducible protein OsmY